MDAIKAGAHYRSAAAVFGAKIAPGFQNALIVGPQGTGKTTFSKILAFEYRAAKIVSSNAPVIFVDAVDLIGEYIGQSEEKTKNFSIPLWMESSSSMKSTH